MTFNNGRFTALHSAESVEYWLYDGDDTVATMRVPGYFVHPTVATGDVIAIANNSGTFAFEVTGTGTITVVDHEPSHRGSAIASGVTVDHDGDGVEVTATITLVNVAITVGDDAPLGVGVNFYDLPAGNISVHSCFVSIGLDDITTLTEMPDFGIGTTVASGVISTLNGNTMENIFGGTALTGSDGELLVDHHKDGLNILTASSHKLYLNLADIWTENADPVGTLSGTVVIRYTRNMA